MTFKVVPESHVTCATSVPNLVILGLSILELGQMYATDRRQTKASLNASFPWGPMHNNSNDFATYAASAECHSSCACNALQIQRNSGEWQSVEYSTFSVSDEAGKYRLSLSGFSGDTVDAMAGSLLAGRNATGMNFSTPDSDNDILVGNCAADSQIGWWFGACSQSRLNYDTDAQWTTSTLGDPNDVQFSRMMVRVD